MNLGFRGVHWSKAKIHLTKVASTIPLHAFPFTAALSTKIPQTTLNNLKTTTNG